MTYEFSPDDWFSRHIPVWQAIIHSFNLKPKKILEVGSFEGRSAVWLIENAFPEGGYLHCIDTWEGSKEHADVDMTAVEKRFDDNIAKAKISKPDVVVKKYKAPSLVMLSRMVGTFNDNFDLIYLDGSHETIDVLTDLALCFHLCRVGGVIICDDYLFQWGKNFNVPKTAIDAIVNCSHGQLQPILNVPIYQLALLKLPAPA